MAGKFIPRIFVNNSLKIHDIVDLDKTKSHYLRNVLKLNIGSIIKIFNGKDGEFTGLIKTCSKNGATIDIKEQLYEQKYSSGVSVLAPMIAKDKFSLMIEKITELGVNKIFPVISERANFSNLNMAKQNQKIIDAVQQSERLDVPKLYTPQKLDNLIKSWKESDGIILFCDEDRKGENIYSVLKNIEINNQYNIFLLVGPEGGFSNNERNFLMSNNNIHNITLNPFVLRSETAAISAVSIVKSFIESNK